MREFHDLDACDGGTDVGPDAPDGNARDAHRPRGVAGEVVQDAVLRTAFALDYRQRVEAEYAAYRATDSKPQDTPADRAERMSREVELPSSARDLPDAREIMPNLHLAELDRRKFSDYSLNPDHPHNGGKAEGWRALGYDVDNLQARHQAAQELREIICDELLTRGKVADTRDTPFGPMHKILNGFIGPNDKHATLVTCWLVEEQSGHSFPKLTTVWVQIHRDKETER